MATPRDVTVAALALWEVEDESGWHPCEEEALRCLRVSGAGRKQLGRCTLQGRAVELNLDARVEVDVASGKRRRLRLACPGAAETAAAEAAVASSSTAHALFSPGLGPSQSGGASPKVQPKKTLSGYFLKTKPEPMPMAPTEPAVQFGKSSEGAPKAVPENDPKTGNEKIACFFDEMSAVQKLKRDRFRSQAYAKAAQALRALAEPIDSGAQAKAIKGIGAGMANRIDVILRTGQLQELEELKMDSDLVALRELRSVHGVGAATAAKLVERGLRSLAQLREAVAKGQVTLDAAQALGLRHCEEFSQRIPQAEMKQHEQLLESHRAKEHSGLLLTICGSYRRGRPDCGDIDVLISHPDYTTTKKEANAGGKLLQAFVTLLKRAGYVTGELAFGQTKFMGVCRLAGLHHRRLDIRCMPFDQYHFGMLYFTGSAALSVKMRLKAIELGLTLNEYGLENKATGEKVPASSEEEIFRALGMDYLAPSER